MTVNGLSAFTIATAGRGLAGSWKEIQHIIK